MKRIVSLSLAFITFLAVSCSKDSDSQLDPTQNPSKVEYKLAEGVKEFNKSQVDLVIDVQEGVLIFDKSISSSDLPKVGDIILVSKENLKFPYGFLGKVNEVAVSDRIYVSTESVALEDAFDFLNVKGTSSLEPQGSENRAEIIYNRNDEFELNYNDILKGKIGVNNRIIVNYDFQIDKQNNKKVSSGSIVTNFSNRINVDGTINVKDIKGDSTFKIGKGIPFGNIVAGPIVIAPIVQPYLESAYEGNIAMKFKLETASSSTNRIVYNNGVWSSTQSGDNRTWDFNPLPDVEINGSACIGASAALEFRFYGQEDTKIYINGGIKVDASGELSAHPERYNEDEGLLYSQLKDAKLTLSSIGSVGIGASAKLFNVVDAKWSHPIVEYPFFESDCYLFPAFENDSIVDDDKKIYTYSELKRNLLWKQDVGLALYEENKRIQQSDPIKYKFENKSGDNVFIDKTFNNVPSGYSVWTYVKWGELFLKCKKINSDNRLIGKWEESHPSGKSYYIFNENGTGSHITRIDIESYEYVTDFLWTLNGKYLTLSKFEKDRYFDYKYIISMSTDGNSFTIVGPIGDEKTSTYTRVE